MRCHCAGMLSLRIYLVLAMLMRTCIAHFAGTEKMQQTITIVTLTVQHLLWCQIPLDMLQRYILRSVFCRLCQIRTCRLLPVVELAFASGFSARPMRCHCAGMLNLRIYLVLAMLMTTCIAQCVALYLLDICLAETASLLMPITLK